MALRTNAALTFSGYEMLDNGVRLHFVCLDPGAGEPSDWYIVLTDSELAAATTALLLRQAVADKLTRKFRAATSAARLDPFIGQTLTI